MKKALLIYNPNSGDHTIINKLDYIIGQFQDNGIYIQPFRFWRYEESELISLFDDIKPDFIVTSGGDGTLNFVVNAMFKKGLDIPLGVIPSGTCNDFANSLGISSVIEDCITTIIKGKTLDVDVGLLNNEKYFLSTFAGGCFVDVSFSTNTELKRNFGPLAYYLKGLQEVKNLRPYNLTITTDDDTVIEEKAFIFLILNGTQGAGLSGLIGEADITDGLMDILIIKRCSHIDLASLFFKVLSRDLTTDKNITKLTAKTCYIKSDKNIPISIDGEKGGELPMQISFIKKALKIFIDKTSDI